MNEYLVKWSNYPDSDNEWVPGDRFFDTDCIKTYMAALVPQKKRAKKSIKTKKGVVKRKKGQTRSGPKITIMTRKRKISELS
jgi:hypothetical protein